MYEDLVPGQVVEPLAGSAYISPDGKFHFVPNCSHFLVAPLLAAGTYAAADQSLMNRGWIHFSFTGVHHDREITQAQRDTLFDVAMAFEQGRYADENAFRCAAQYKRALSYVLEMELSPDIAPYKLEQATQPEQPKSAPQVRGRRRVTQRNAEEMLTLVRRTYRGSDQFSLRLVKDSVLYLQDNWVIRWADGPRGWANDMVDVLFRKVGNGGAFWVEPYDGETLVLWTRGS